ncbi:MAG: rod shape-determining protein RodA [Clostridiales bacterium]|jgi:rod shape-determining protein rodA|nr:rod shape-determining protein RodA [Clostridiales bacterium]
MAKLLDRSGWKKIDWLLIANIVALVIVGLISITAATADPATGEEVTLADKIANLNFSTVWRQCVWFLVGVVGMIAAFSIDYNYLKEITPIIYWVNIVILLLLFALATATNNTVSWYKFGNIGFQPSELAKISTILMLSRALAARTGDEKITSFREFFHLAKYAVIPFILIAVQPDLGTAMVVACITIGIFFVARVDKKIVLSCIGAVAAILPVAWLFMKDYQRNRILVFFGLAQDSASQYNVNMSKMAIGNGQLTGNGLFGTGGMSQLNWVPVKESDFIFAVTGETFGFIGGLIVVLLFGLLLWRTISIALRARDKYAMYVVVGVACMIFAHVFENIGMAMGVMPVTGIPLPFISYGGSNMLTNMLAYGIVLNIATKW